MKVREYSNGEVTIVWKPDLYIHAGICVEMLPKVYRPKERPWIDPHQATSDEIRKQVAECPSGALTIKEKE